MTLFWIKVTYNLHKKGDVVIAKRQNRKGVKIKLYKNVNAAVRKIIFLCFLRYSSSNFVLKIGWMEKG